MRIAGDDGLQSKSWAGLQDTFRQTLDSSISICKKTVDTLRERAGGKVFIVDNIREPMIPVGQQKRRGDSLSL